MIIHTKTFFSVSWQISPLCFLDPKVFFEALLLRLPPACTCTVCKNHLKCLIWFFIFVCIAKYSNIWIFAPKNGQYFTLVSNIFGAKIQRFENKQCSLRSKCCKIRLFWVIFNHCESFALSYNNQVSLSLTLFETFIFCPM